jgi:hypothetical protein
MGQDHPQQYQERHHRHLPRHPGPSIYRASGNKQRTSTRGGILKAEAVLGFAKGFAKALKKAGVEDFPDSRSLDRADAARQSVRCVTGQGSGISFAYLMMMADDDSFVKADRMVCRFGGQAAGIPVVTTEQAKVAVVGACKELVDQYPNLTPRLLDHLIWLNMQGK